MCFVHFDLTIFFAPQRRAIFPHLNFQKWSGAGVLCTFLLEMCFATLSSYLRTRRFSEPTFRPSRHTNPRKNTAFRDFPNISRWCIFFLLTFAQLHLLSSDSTSLLCAFHLCSAFQLSILSEVRLLNFL